MTTIQRIQIQLRASAQQNYTAVAAPPFTYFFNPDDPSPWSNYAIPDFPVAGDLTTALTALVTTFRARERLPRCEFIEEFAPDLASALAAYGFVEEMRALLMLCTPETYQPAASMPDVTATELTVAAPLAAFQEFLTVQRRGFSNEDATAVTAAEAAGFQRRFQTTRLFAVRADDHFVSAGCLLPVHNGITEITGIATLPAFRRQGMATLLTSYAVQAAFDQGLDGVFLTAGSAAAGRVYGRVGFRTVGSGMAYVWPEQQR